jgi:hypothetical protein
MNTFLESAREILTEASKPLHYKELTQRAIELGLKTQGATPWATMNALIASNIKMNGADSQFYRSEPGFYGLNQVGQPKVLTSERGAEVTGILHKITDSLNSKQKGDIAEARVAELITLYGDEGLSCYRPISDDEGIDIIVKKRGVLDVAYVQVKSTFGNGSGGFVCSVKENKIANKRKMLMVFVYFDLTDGDLHEHVFCVPGSEFLKLTYNENKQPGHRVFTVSLNSPDKSKYARFLIEKRELANKILEILSES